PPPLYVYLTEERHPIPLLLGSRTQRDHIETKLPLHAPLGDEVVLIRLQISGFIPMRRQNQDQVDIVGFIHAAHHEAAVDDHAAAAAGSLDRREIVTQFPE